MLRASAPTQPSVWVVHERMSARRGVMRSTMVPEIMPAVIAVKLQQKSTREASSGEPFIAITMKVMVMRDIASESWLRARAAAVR